METLDLKAMGPNTFGLMKQSIKEAKVVYPWLHLLQKFSRFAETEIDVVVAKEHTVPVQSSFTTFEIVFDDESDTSPSRPLKKEHHEKVQQSVPTIEQLEVFETFKETALKPPQPVIVTDDEVVENESDTDHVTHKGRK